MYSKNYYTYQLEHFTELESKCTDKVTLKKLRKTISKLKHLIDECDSTTQVEECHCSACMSQG